MRRNARLHDDARVLRIDARGQEKRGKFADFRPQFLRILIHRDRVQIHDAEDTFVVVLDPDPVRQGAEIVADMQIAGRLYARQNAGFHRLGSETVIVAAAARPAANIIPVARSAFREPGSILAESAQSYLLA